MIRRDYLIVGAGVGGASACEGIREHDSKGSIMLVGAESALPYHRPQIFPAILGKGAPSPGSLFIHDAEWYEKKRVDLRLDTVVTQFNQERHLAVLGNGQAVEFKKACLCTGSRAHRPQVAGYNLGNIFYPRSLRDVLALREAVEVEKDIVIVGGGRVAAEVAALLSQRPKLNLTLLHRGRHLWSRWIDEDTGAWLTELFTKHGVKMMLGETLNGFEGRTILRNVQTKSGQRFSAHAAVVALGSEMNNGLFLNTPLNYPAGTPVSEYLETDEKGVFAAGGIALYPDKVFGGQRRIEQYDCTVAQGRTAGANMTGKKRIKWDWMPHFHSEIFGIRFDFTGDFSKPTTRIEIEGDRAKKKFVIRRYHLTALIGITLCNQTAEKVEAAKDEIRAWKREVKRYES